MACSIYPYDSVRNKADLGYNLKRAASAAIIMAEATKLVSAIFFMPLKLIAEPVRCSAEWRKKESPDTVAGSSRRFPMHSVVPDDSVAKLSHLSETYKKIPGNRRVKATMHEFLNKSSQILLIVMR